jgi:uncharacterized protein YqfB (UPF0267 family)
MTHHIQTFSSMHILSNMDAIPSNRAPTNAQLLLQSTVALLFDIDWLIYLLTAVGLSPSGSTHLHTNNTQNNTNNNRTTQITNNVEGCEPCPVFASFTLAFALQLRKKHGKTTVRVRQTSVKLIKTSVKLIKTSVRVQYTYYQDTHTLQNRHKHTYYKTHIYIHIHTHTHTHTLQNNIKPPQYKLKQTQYKIYPNEIQQYTIDTEAKQTMWNLNTTLFAHVNLNDTNMDLNSENNCECSQHWCQSSCRLKGM